MTLQTKSADVRYFKICYSRFFYKFEITFIGILFLSLILIRNELWFLPVLILSCLICFIYFSLFSINHHLPEKLVIEFRTAPDQLICYDSSGETSFLLHDIEFRMTRWFIILKLKSAFGIRNFILLADCFEDMNYYSNFRRQLLLRKSEPVC